MKDKSNEIANCGCAVHTYAVCAIVGQFCSKWTGTRVVPGVHNTQQTEVAAHVILTHIDP